MKETPILYKPGMVVAVRNDRKTHTRRLNGLGKINESPDIYTVTGYDSSGKAWFLDNSGNFTSLQCPYGGMGDRLWVREAWSVPAMFDRKKPSDLDPHEMEVFDCVRYHADGVTSDGKTRVSIHMPRWASRINLEIVNVRIERVNDITEEDAKAEGVDWLHPESEVYYKDYLLRTLQGCQTAKESFYTLWDSINKENGYGWGVNPWVWVVEFRRVGANG